MAENLAKRRDLSVVTAGKKKYHYSRMCKAAKNEENLQYLSHSRDDYRVSVMRKEQGAYYSHNNYINIKIVAINFHIDSGADVYIFDEDSFSMYTYMFFFKSLPVPLLINSHILESIYI